MNLRWAASIPRESLRLAGRLRLEPIDVCSTDDCVWLKGTCRSDEGRPENEELLTALPGLRLFTVDSNDLLTPVNQKVPVGKLPQGPWVAIGEALAVQTPAAALPGILERKVRVGLARSGIEREANVVIAELDAWREFGIAAPAIRLKNLRFALSTSRALIWGAPAPAIPGARFVEENGIAVPCGFALYPLSDPEILWALLRRRSPGVSPGRSIDKGRAEFETTGRDARTTNHDLAVFFEDGTVDLIDGSLFVAATRSAIRQPLSGSVVA